jgi:hypothetical protein
VTSSAPSPPGQTLHEDIRGELEASRAAFHALLGTLSPDDLKVKSGNPAWTVEEVLNHLVLGLKSLPLEVFLVRRLGRFPPAPPRLLNWLNAQITRAATRGLTLAEAARKYDRAHQGVLRLLDGIRDQDWEKSAVLPPLDPLLQGRITVEDLFRYVATHLDVHTEEIRRGLQARENAQP